MTNLEALEEARECVLEAIMRHDRDYGRTLPRYVREAEALEALLEKLAEMTKEMSTTNDQSRQPPSKRARWRRMRRKGKG